MTKQGASALGARLAANVRRLRGERGLTLQAMSEFSGVNIRHLQKIEAQDVDPGLSTVQRLAEGFDVDPVELLVGPSCPTTPPNVRSSRRSQ